MGRIVARRRITRVRAGGGSRPPEIQRAPDSLAVEEPLEIRVGGRALVIIMRTPGHDVELATGFLVSEGVASAAGDVNTARYCAGTDDDGHNTYNVLDVSLAPGVAPPDPSLERNFYTTSSCGLCGKASIDAVRTRSVFEPGSREFRMDPAMLATLPDKLRDRQEVFEKTGGLHAAGLFDSRGELLVVREDVGRHNAVDKVVGWALQDGRLPLRDTVLMVSGRVSFELVQKAMMAGIPMMTAVSAPSSLAVEMAAEAGMTVVGFLRGESMVVYCGEERITGAIGAEAGNSEGAA